jgi:rRNA maturation protein Nop10
METIKVEIREKSKNELFYVLKYDSKKGERNTIKLGITPVQTKSNKYNIFYLPEIDRYANCQTIETMFAHKLVSLTDRYQKYRMMAGRDLYDIHYFFLQGYGYIEEIIEERTGKKLKEYLAELKNFIERKITGIVISEDLNFLLPPEKFKKVRKILKKETLMFLVNEIDRWG